MAETFDQINEYAPADDDPTNLMEVTDETRIGMHELTITEYDTTTIPEIAIGSLIEVNGTMFKVNDTGGGTGMPIIGSPSVGTVYVMLVPSGSAPNQILTPNFTGTPPTWFDSKQGWYDATGTNRYIHYAMTYTDPLYTPKWEFVTKNNKDVHFLQEGSITAEKVLHGNEMGKFHAVLISGSVSAGIIIYNSETFDVNGEYDVSTGIFTAQKSGYYQFNCNLEIITPSAGATINIFMRKDALGTPVDYSGAFSKSLGASESYNCSPHAVIDLVVGDTVEMVITITGTMSYRTTSGANSFSGFLTT